MQDLALYIGQKIRELRDAAGITQHQLAKKLKVTANTVSRWETGFYKPEINQIEEIARALGTKIWALLPAEAAPPENRQLGRLLSKAGDLASKDIDELIRYTDFIRARTALSKAKRGRRTSEGKTGDSD